MGKFVKVLISKKGRLYREAVEAIVAESGLEPMKGAVAIKQIIYCPDWRRRDADNLNKAILDSISHAGLIEDDSFICAGVFEKRHDPDGQGRVLLQFKTVPGATVKAAGAWLT